MNNFEFRQPIVQRAAPTTQTIRLPQTPAVVGRRLYFRPRPAPKPNPWWQRLQLAGLVIGVLAGGFIAQTLIVGVSLLGAYAIAAWIARIPSRTSFTLALLLLVAISTLLLFKPNPQLTENFATYTFILLLIGVVTLGREARMPKRTRRTYRR